MLTPQSLRVARPPQEGSAVREQRPDDVVSLMQVRGEITSAGAWDVCGRIEAALKDGVRWALVDLTDAPSVDDSVIPWLVHGARELRARRGELIVAGADPTVASRLAAYEVADRPALAATADQALMILKMLRPKTFKRREAAPAPAARRRITSLKLPRIEPQH